MVLSFSVSRAVVLCTQFQGHTACNYKHGVINKLLFNTAF